MTICSYCGIEEVTSLPCSFCGRLPEHRDERQSVPQTQPPKAKRNWLKAATVLTFVLLLFVAAGGLTGLYYIYVMLAIAFSGNG